MIKQRLVLMMGLLVAFISLKAQPDFNISIIYDRPQTDASLIQSSFKAEIRALMGANYTLHFTEHFSNGEVLRTQKIIEEIFKQNTADVLIGAGLITSQILSEQESFPLPTIAAVNTENLLTDNNTEVALTSSVYNFTYIESPFDIGKDLETLSQLKDIKTIAILVNPELKSSDYNLDRHYARSEHIDYRLVSIENDPGATIDSLGDDIDAVYLFSTLPDYDQAKAERLFQGIIDKGIPSLSFIDYPMLDYGAYAAYSSEENIRKIPRRVAINVLKIAEGINPKDLPVQMETFGSQLLINMEAVNKTGVYPNWTILDDAILVNVNLSGPGRKLTLKSAIAEGLENNLGYQAAKKQTLMVKQDVALARSNLLPQLEASSTGLLLDEQTVSSSFGTRGEFNWSAGASFSQLILSEPALANLSIQKLLSERQEQAEIQSELDVVLDVVTAYMYCQQALSLVELSNENVRVKNENLKIAVNKEKVGYSGETDVYRWETELALAKADFNEAEVQLKTAKFNLNQVLNRPVNEDFSMDDPANYENIQQIFDGRIVSIIENPGSLKLFADFLTQEAMNNLPEIQQVELALKVQERLLKSNKRALFTPSLAIAANYDYPISIVNPGEPLPIPGVEISSGPTWNAAVVASFPIFNGGSRKHQKQKTQIELYQLQDEREDLGNKLEFQIRASLEKVQTSYRNHQLNRHAAESAKKNVEIVQDLYNEGLVSVVNLIDAQNAYLGAEINASNSLYQFIIDLFTLERYTGQYLSLSPEEERNDFIQRFIQSTMN